MASSIIKGTNNKRYEQNTRGMSTVIKLRGYRADDIEEFVEEQLGRNAGRWEYWRQQQTVRLNKTYITFGYAKAKLAQRPVTNLKVNSKGRNNNGRNNWVTKRII